MADDGEEVDENYDPEQEVTGNFKPLQELPEVPQMTGEENEDVVVKFRTKLYRHRDNQWKERGAGDLKLLKDRTTNKIRVLMRQDKTLKIVANFLVSGHPPLCKLFPNKTTEKAWIWECYDFSDEKPTLDKLCGRFVSVEEYKKFQVEFEKAYASNQELANKQQSESQDKKPDT